MRNNRKAKVVRFLSPWEMIAENSARECKKIRSQNKSANRQKALRVKTPMPAVVFVKAGA